MSQGKDSINLNDPQFGWMKGMMERQGQAIPANGLVTKQMFISEMQKRMGGAQAVRPVEQWWSRWAPARWARMDA